jgi:cytochrome oxidase assembly protein ShyY1
MDGACAKNILGFVLVVIFFSFSISEPTTIDFQNNHLIYFSFRFCHCCFFTCIYFILDYPCNRNLLSI